MDTGLVYHPVFLRHCPGPDHPESPRRLDAAIEGLDNAGLLPRMVRLSFAPATPGDLALIHEPAYVELVRAACDRGLRFIGDPDTHLSPESYRVACLATGGVLAASDAVLRGKVGKAFCAVRPPGHHAERDRAGGFCLFNHVAVAAEHLILRRGVERVAIVDLDTHHGNGTQAAFWRRSDVLYISVHGHMLAGDFPGTGFPGEQGEGPGQGFTQNLFAPRGACGQTYLQIIREGVVPRLDRFAPHFVLVSAGFDTHRSDPLGRCRLEAKDYGPITAEIVAVADRHARGRLVSVLEGGYALETLGACIAAHVGALMGDPPSAP